MAAPITIKKRTFSVKASTASDRTGTPMEADAGAGTDADAEEIDAPISFQAPVAEAARPPSYVFPGICAIIATLLFAVILILQWVELSDLNTAIPRPIPTGHIISP